MTPKLKKKPSGIYYWEFEGEKGERRRVSTNTRDREKAQKMGKQTVFADQGATKQPQRSHLQPGLVTMNNLFDRCEKTVWAPEEAKSQATIRSNIKILSDLEVTTKDIQGRLVRTWTFGNEPANEITYSKLEDVVVALKARGYAPATIKRKLDMVSKALRMGTKWSHPDGRPLVREKPIMPFIRISNLKDRVLHGAADAKLMGVPDEEKALFEALDKRQACEPNRPWFRIRALLRFLMDTGGRLTESLQTGPEDITYRPVLLPDGSVIQRPVVVFPRYDTKSDKPRMVPLTDAAYEALQSLKDHVALVKVKAQAGVKREKLVYFGLRQATVWYMLGNLKEDLKASGTDISDITAHTLRHTCLTRLARGGMDLLRLQQWAGHSDPKITAARYAHLIPSNLMDGLLLLGSTNGTTPPIQEQISDSHVNGLVPDHGATYDNPGTATLN